MAGSAAEFTMSNYTEKLNELSLDNSNLQIFQSAIKTMIYIIKTHSF